MRYLVTGGEGFIASHLVDKLILQGHDVTVLDKVPQKRHINDVRYLQTDICTDYQVVFQDGRFDGVFHLAAIPSVQRSIKEPQETQRVNFHGTLKLLKAAQEYGVKRFVFSSSAAVYGDSTALPLKEDQLCTPASPYGKQKLDSETILQDFHARHGMETISLRYFNVYGPRQNPKGDYASLIPRTINTIKSGTSPKIYGDGEQTRDFIYISDVIRANISASTTTNSYCFGQAFNIGTGKKTSVNKLVNAIRNYMGTRLSPTYSSGIKEIRDSVANISKAQSMLGWQPVVSLKQGIERTVQSY